MFNKLFLERMPQKKMLHNEGDTMKKLSVFLCFVLLISSMYLTLFAEEEYDQEEADSWLIWGYSCRHELFLDAAPDRPITISPRLWYMKHKEPQATYKVEIMFEGFAYITKEAVQEIKETYAKEQGFDSWEAWCQEYPDELDGTGDVHRYLEQQRLQWHIENNQSLVDQYMRPEDHYEWHVTLFACNLICELPWERIVELANAGDGRTVFVEYDRAALTGGVNLFPEFQDPVEPTTSVTTQKETTEAPTTQPTEPSAQQQTDAEVSDTVATKVPETQMQSSDEGSHCIGAISVCSVCVIVLCGVIAFKKKE